ncbi:MAG TPA: S1C family serine protease [Pirellulales bacterium]|nr:S1C family serine protease [Pirellulales bacterium]
MMWPMRLAPLSSLLSLAICLVSSPPAFCADSLADVIQQVEPKIVKIYGAGGFRGLEAYQSGFLISADGQIVTAWSYVLDTEYVGVTLDDGRKFDAKLLGADPRLEVAVLKIDAVDLPYFDLGRSADLAVGARVLAFSNLFGVATGSEPASVQHGVVAVTAPLEARRGTFDTPYHGVAYILDAMTNNPGAQGGALTDRRGQLAGMLGKELRNSQTNTWLNYAVPIGELVPTIDAIRAGKFVPASTNETAAKPKHALSAPLLGLVMVPDVLDRTPPFVERVLADSSAATAGLAPDDLIVFVNGRLVQSCRALTTELEHIDRADKAKVTILRDQQLLEFELLAPPQEP